MDKLNREGQVSAIIRSNLITFGLNPNEIRSIVEQTTADIMDFLDNYESKNVASRERRSPPSYE